MSVVADRLSRTHMDVSDFMLTKYYFDQICKKFGTPVVDLFATYQTKQCKKFNSWKPDQLGFYAFPPFNLVGKVISKIIIEKSKGIVVASHWSTQPWFSLFQKLAVSEILIFGPNKRLLFNHYSREYHQINPSLQLMVAILSGNQ